VNIQEVGGNSDLISPIVSPAQRQGTSPIGTSSENSSGTASTNASYGVGAFTSGINYQGTNTAYAVQNTDYQGVIIFNTAATVTLTLNSALVNNFTCTILNLSTGVISLVPSALPAAYLVNGVASLTLPTGAGCQIFFSNRTWYAYVGATVVNPAILVGGVASLGGSSMTVGQTISATATVPGAATNMVAITQPFSNPGAGFLWQAYVSSANTVTVELTCVVAGTPANTSYNVRVIQ
jgi:hypothetical protein